MLLHTSSLCNNILLLLHTAILRYVTLYLYLCSKSDIIIFSIPFISGLVGACFVYILTQVNQCDTADVTLKLNVSSYEYYFIAYSIAFQVLFSVTFYVGALLSIFLLDLPLPSFKLTSNWITVLIVSTAIVQIVTPKMFDSKSYTIIDCLIFYPKSDDDFVVEHFKDLHLIMCLFRSVFVPFVIILCVTLVFVVKAKRPRKKINAEEELENGEVEVKLPVYTSKSLADILILFVILIRGILLLILLLLRHLEPSGLFDTSTKRILINYGMVVLPSLIGAGLHPVLLFLEERKLCTIKGIMDVGSTASVSSHQEENKSSSDENYEILSIKDFADIKKIQRDKLDARIQLPSFLNFVQKRDERRVAILVKESQARADAKREDVARLVEVKQREREILIDEARKNLKIEKPKDNDMLPKDKSKDKNKKDGTLEKKKNNNTLEKNKKKKEVTDPIYSQVKK